MSTLSFRLKPLAVAAALAAATSSFAQTATAPNETTLSEVRVLGTAEEELRQALGSSVITQEDIERRPPANDLSELIRTQPGVNLTGNSATGAFGNNRQIDLRGMGPENTLILVDGKPVQSRNSAKMGRNGERDTRGDTDWVPAEQVERIEIIRGPAAARYGSGAAGGVINIITKRPGDKFSGSISTYYMLPEDSDYGSSRRLGFNLSGPLSENLSFRLYGNVKKTERDDPNLNANVYTGTGNPPAPREGSRNRDINALLRWDINPEHIVELETGFSRQGNIYAGERQLNATLTAAQQALVDESAEVRRTYRETMSVTHRGKWGDVGDSKLVLQYEGTTSVDCAKGLAGSSEGACGVPLRFVDSKLKNYYANGELNTPLNLGGFDQILTSGIEWRAEKLDDPYSMSQSAASGGGVPGLGGNRTGKTDAKNLALYVEDNIEITTPFILTPGLRFDHHDQFGNNWSPSLNASYELTSELTLKGGIAKAFKAPNLYQSNPNYLYFSMGQGCPVDNISLGGGCYIQGNSALNAETSVNKEIGLAWNNRRGWEASASYFRNDYKNKIIAEMFGEDPLETGTGSAISQIFQWHNAGKAVVQGFEGNLTVPLVGSNGNRLKLINNFTYMVKNKNKETGQPLSIIPRYTVNSTLDWKATDKLSAQLTATLYGRQEPRTVQTGGAASVNAELNKRGSYALFGVGGNYEFSKNYRAAFGVANLLNKELYRGANSSGAGAATYNEPGRAYYASFTASF